MSIMQHCGMILVVVLAVASIPAATAQAAAQAAIHPAKALRSGILSWRKGPSSPCTGIAKPIDTASRPSRTHVAELAEVFENDILKPASLRGSSGKIRGGGQMQDIYVPQLLHACRKFEAAMRVLGEKQTANLLHSNICKVETLYRSAPADQRNYMTSLLQYEKEQGVHPTSSSDQRLKDSSAAMGLLWIRRTLAFNCKWYSLITASDRHPRDAALVAYQAILERYHGWALRRLAIMGIKSSIPARSTLLACLGGFEPDSATSQLEQTTVSDMRRLVAAWQPLITKWQQTFQALELEDTRRV